MGSETPLLRLENVTKAYISSVSGEAVLRNLNLEINEGDGLAITGPSGSGKSTLLNLLGTLDKPTSGRVLFEGEDVGSFSEKKLAAIRNLKIGFIFQLHHLLPQCTVLENVLVPTLVSGRPSAEAADRARALLDRVGLSHRISHRPGLLSGGECQRVAVVRALINRPRIVLADEPTGSLDHAGADNLGNLLDELNRKDGTTLVVVTHSAGLARRMKTSMELKDGTLSTGSG